MNRSELKQQAKDLLRNNLWMGALYSFAGLVIAFVCVFGCGLLVACCAKFITLFFNGDSTSASAIALAVGLLLGILLGAIISSYFSTGLCFLMLEWAKTKKRPQHWFHLFVTPFTAGYFWLTLRVSLLLFIWTFFWQLFFVPLGWAKEYAYSQTLLIMREHVEAGEKVTARQCINESRRLMNGWKEDLFILDLSFMNWELPVVLVGFIVALFLQRLNQVFLLWGSSIIPVVAGCIVAILLMMFVSTYQYLTKVCFYLQLKREFHSATASIPVVIYPNGQAETLAGEEVGKRPSSKPFWIIGIAVNAVLLAGIFLNWGLCRLSPNLRATICGNEYRVTIKGEVLGFDYTQHARIIFHTNNAYMNTGDEGQHFTFLPVDGHHDRARWRRRVRSFLDDLENYPKYEVKPSQNEIILNDRDNDPAIELQHVKRSDHGRVLTARWHVKETDMTYHVKLQKVN
ncbi:DUF975 family protein [Ligilactobacillus sp. LYQ139]|uniref:DUF975 family protein n=1 Tax=Ligilactobacillus sp. LYQ139 TaxID=3378800 RepID=UPI003853C156